MTLADKPRLCELLVGLAELHDIQVSPTRAEIYFGALRDLSIDDVERAVIASTRTGTFFPKPAELRQQIEGSPEGAASEAWVSYVYAVGHPRAEASLPPEAIEAGRLTFGSMMHARRTLPDGSGDTGPQLLGYRKNFISNYHIAKQRIAFGALDAPWMLSKVIQDVRAWEKRQELPSAKPAERLEPQRKPELVPVK